MGIKYRMDILKALKNKGYTSNRLRQEKIFGEGVIAKMRNNEMVSYAMLARVCYLLECQPGDLLQYTPDDSDFKKDLTRSHSAGRKMVDGKFIIMDET